MELSILPIGDFDEEFLLSMKNGLSYFKFKIVILEKVEIEKKAFVERRNQY